MAATILVCDDEDVLRALIRAALDDGRFRIVEAASGDDALTQARASKPDVILLDMMMPGRTGIQVLEELRANADLAETPVVMLTARTQTTDREAAEQAGATRFLGKPFSPSELVSIVEELVPQR